MERTITSVIATVHRCKGRSQCSVVDVATRLWAGQLQNYALFPKRGTGLISCQISDLSLLQNVQTICEAHQASCQSVLEAFSPLVKQLGDKPDHSPLSGVVVKNEWS